MVAAGLAAQSGSIGPGSSRKRVAQVELSGARPHLAVARHAGRQHAVEEIDPALDRRRSRAARPRPSGSGRAGRHPGRRHHVQRRAPSRPWTPPPTARRSRSRRRQPSNGGRALASQRRVDAALHDPEQRLVRPAVSGQAALRPGVGAGHGRRHRRAGRVASTSWSKAMAMSLPSASWISIARSGVSRWLEPSRWLAKVTPSSSTRPRWARLKTWKPPESVRIGPSQPMNRWSPPSVAMRSWPGRSDRW